MSANTIKWNFESDYFDYRKNITYLYQCYKSNTIFGLILFLIIIALTIWACVQEKYEYDSILNIPPYSDNPDPEYYGCISQNKVVWRDALIGAIISTLIIFFFLYVLNFPISFFLFIIVSAVVFVTYYSIANFRNFHWYGEVCNASKS